MCGWIGSSRRKMGVDKRQLVRAGARADQLRELLKDGIPNLAKTFQKMVYGEDTIFDDLDIAGIKLALEFLILELGSEVLLDDSKLD